MFEELLVKIARELDRFSVPYMIIGGQAVLLYGEPRFTRDIDVTLGIDIDEFSKLKQVIESLHLKILPENADKFIAETRALPVLDESSGLRIDFVFSFIGFERQAIERALKVQISNYPVSYVSVEDLLIYKMAAGRAIDFEDVKNVLSKNSNYNKAYVTKWLTDFGKVLGKPLLKSFEEIIRDIKAS